MVEQFYCSECDKEISRRAARRTGRCPSCNLQRAVESANQLHAHAGPYYEKWKKAWLASRPAQRRKENA